MTVYFVNVIIIFIVTVICPSESLFCGYGERFSLCGNHKCQATCEHPQGPKFCEPICKPGCVCNSGLVRRETDNKCVPIEECPNKPSEERPQEKPSRPDEKPGPEKSERKGRRLYTQRQANLVGLDMCPEGQTFSLCGNHQCQPTCRNPAGPKGCEPTCRPGCVCKSGFVRRESDHECVQLKDCPGKGKVIPPPWRRPWRRGGGKKPCKVIRPPGFPHPVTCGKGGGKEAIVIEQVIAPHSRGPWDRGNGKVIPHRKPRPWRRGGGKKTHYVIQPQIIPHPIPCGKGGGFPHPIPCGGGGRKKTHYVIQPQIIPHPNPCGKGEGKKPYEVIPPQGFPHPGPCGKGGGKETYIVIERHGKPHPGPWGGGGGIPVPIPCGKRPKFPSRIDIGPCEPKVIQIPWGK